MHILLKRAHAAAWYAPAESVCGADHCHRGIGVPDVGAVAAQIVAAAAVGVVDDGDATRVIARVGTGVDTVGVKCRKSQTGPCDRWRSQTCGMRRR